jgi:glycosyltransferase involved in cell wall biosynthesis
MLDRNTIRSRWSGQTGIDDGNFVIGMLGEPVAAVDVRDAATMAARLALAGREIRLLVHSAAVGRIAAQRFLERLSLNDVLIIDDAVAEPWRVVSGLDAALLLSGIGRPVNFALPLLWALAAGLPVIAEALPGSGRPAGPLVHDDIEDEVNGLLVQPGDVNGACCRLARVYDDRAAGARLGRAAKALVNDACHINAYCMRLKHVYELLMAHRAAGSHALTL